MGEFSGFPAKTNYVPLPAIFFSTLLPEITDITELKVTLYLVSTLYQKRGYPRFVTRDELWCNVGLRKSLRDSGEPEEKALSRALEAAARRGTVIHVSEYNIYLLNTEADREAAEQIKRGEITLPNLKRIKAVELDKEATVDSSDIFAVYEENIGMLTPIIADWLKEAEKRYPRSWVVDAIKEAVGANKRNWRYIARILERWQSEGKGDGTYQRYSEKKQDADKFVRGKYGHMVQR